ncbi:AurF N-oxygenase family protein [Actinokineospora globicatena]|uniref:AurF N-oxygenase family protein n=1 Tax=Actinokineospora globicatena TaxID=103729 RepID=UPI0020A4E2FB|nr:diiron oxygenase [Actinokineospora globicatena]MCP2300398.1 P-aminobenzoate N-oxygenase AurF [Actinokineospora globicatena]GLW80930.1 membrane protein [Actinokineospora globicatena]GLW88123.1 membrane protein [Actinokineospora globicatena]
MSRATQVAKLADREKTAGRLLKSSADKFYDPEIDIDWGAEIPADLHFHPEHRISLYGTELWDTLTPQQRIELGKHEIASIASTGIFFEVLLMQMLLKQVYRHDPTTDHVHYLLAEIADECRHSTMFGKACKRFGVPAYGPRRWVKQLAKVLPVLSRGPSAYAAILVAEEVLDRMQRENMVDPTLQPLIRMVNRIHVLEEARHVTFARQEVVQGMAKAGWLAKRYHRLLTAVVSYFVALSLVNPEVYRAVGLDPKQAWKAAKANPHFQETIRYWGERIMKFLDEADLVGGPGMVLWRRSMLLAP